MMVHDGTPSSQDINGGNSFYTQMEGSVILCEEKQGAEEYTVHHYLCKGEEVCMCNCCLRIKYVWKNNQETGNTGVRELDGGWESLNVSVITCCFLKINISFKGGEDASDMYNYYKFMARATLKEKIRWHNLDERIMGKRDHCFLSKASLEQKCGRKWCSCPGAFSNRNSSKKLKEVTVDGWGLALLKCQPSPVAWEHRKILPQTVNNSALVKTQSAWASNFHSRSRNDSIAKPHR